MGFVLDVQRVSNDDWSGFNLPLRFSKRTQNYFPVWNETAVFKFRAHAQSHPPSCLMVFDVTKR
jgi:hypothetical protein